MMLSYSYFEPRLILGIKFRCFCKNGNVETHVSSQKIFAPSFQVDRKKNILLWSGSGINAGCREVTVTGSDIDMRYYQDIQPWAMDGETLKVETDNDHLGQIISGQNQYQKNIDLRLNKARKCLFSLLGPCFAYKNKSNRVA